MCSYEISSIEIELDKRKTLVKVILKNRIIVVFKQKKAYDIRLSLLSSEKCIRDKNWAVSGS